MNETMFFGLHFHFFTLFSSLSLSLSFLILYLSAFLSSLSFAHFLPFLTVNKINRRKLQQSIVFPVQHFLLSRKAIFEKGRERDESENERDESENERDESENERDESESERDESEDRESD